MEHLHTHRVVGEERVEYYVGNGDDCVTLDEHVRVLQSEAWSQGYAAGYGDAFFETRGGPFDSDAHEHPHNNPHEDE